MKPECLLILIFVAIGAAVKINGTEEKILSRKKRYLIFPEGSSLQLVYCLTMPILGKSTIFTIGGTAALAWELPHDPFHTIRKQAELAAEKKDDKPIEKENFIPPKKYYTKLNYSNYLKQNFYKASPAYREALRRRIYSYPQQTYYTSTYKEPLTTYLHPVYHHVHRRTRRDMYSKIEKFFTAQSKDGRACLLKAICEVSQATEQKGTFIQEIIKAIFRVKPYDAYKDEDEYDKAANKNHNCTDLYPTCMSSVWNYS